jgi:hypothetical protein
MLFSISEVEMFAVAELISCSKASTATASPVTDNAVVDVWIVALEVGLFGAGVAEELEELLVPLVPLVGIIDVFRGILETKR